MPSSDYDDVFDEVAALKAAKEEELKKRVAGSEEPDPADRPATKVVTFRWYDRVLRRKVAEDFEIRLMTYRERIVRARTAGLMAQVNWSLLPDDTQQYLLALATSNVLWPKASDAWKRVILEREEVALEAYAVVEAHRREYFRSDNGPGGEDASEMGLEVVPVDHPAPSGTR
jgi:hypothetical protein